MRAPAACGTSSGYQRHRRHGERPCGACLDAWATYCRERRHNDPAAAQANRDLVRAHGRAMTRLAQKYRAEYRALVAEEMRLMREGAA